MAIYNLQPCKTSARPWVLLVEDDLLVQKINYVLLERAGCQVTAVGTGGQAVTEANDQYDLILMDLGLPDMTGYDAMSQIRQKLGNKLTPIIVLTAFDVREVEEKCLAVGANEVFSKTLPPDDFEAIVHRYLNCSE